MKRPLGAQISHMLKDRGVDTIFGIPGVHNVEMYRGIEEAGITHVLARHEQGAGFMADGYARATGKPGVAYVITGPGLCNIMTPMGQAYSDSVPMLVMSSCLDEVAAKKGQLHQMKDQRAAAETVCDWSEEAKTAQAAYQLVDRAFGEFVTARPRPKHIQVPIAVLGAEAEYCAPKTVTPALPTAGAAQIEAVAKGLAAAKRPLFVFGGGALQAAAEARAVLAKTKAASFTSFAGRGVTAMDDPLCFGAGLIQPESARILETADYVVAVGTELAEVDLWRDELGHKGTFVRVDIDPPMLADLMAVPDMTILSDAKAFLAGLADVVQSGETEWSAAEVAETRKRWKAEISADRPGIVEIADVVLDALPEGTQIFSDMTQFAYVSKETTYMDAPGRWHHPYGFGTLGYALPAAIGGKIGVGDAPVIAMAGDYGFQYTVQELGVAVELGLSLPIILWDNGKLKEIEDCMVNSQIAPNAVQALNPDFCKLAEAWGALSAAPDSLEALRAAIAAAFKADGPTLIYVTPDIL
ncbi:5-guanidino-2-oxopentanoate decarboxylase [Neptunicoccus cionae]|uniref:2-ketoarginine decarboxylase AruI n=1 Tax=Neptunicoccus cionae TaxID=2035344 RepID=A0A916QZZ3_9RHOB|nr:5-guanidino-2-oxopentanoate decarboxylase [Amylibacter cionae]GGA23171.1 putative 2-ketoarginine decarboxylase AruI [Amylibacter cionae]